MKKIFITTAIDYTNDVIHIGHAYQKVVSDCLARYYRIIKGNENVFFLTGTDEHGANIEAAAKKNNVSPKEFVDSIAKQDQEQWKSLNISYDRFMRTTDEDHKKVVYEFWERSLAKGDIYKGTYIGQYCLGCESYKTDSEIVDGKCALHPTKELQTISEENYFFKWPNYQEFLEELYKQNPNFVYPEGKYKEMLAFLKNGLEDFPISRKQVSWGIPVPNDPEQTIYVWFDALVNYYTAGKEKGFWDEDTEIVHILGKDNLRWHALLWPAMLKSAPLRLPDKVYGHGFMNLNGEKISKSSGNFIRPIELVDQFGTDGVRYFLLKYGPAQEDVDISLEKIKIIYNSELANDWGNLVSRIAKLCEKNEFTPPKSSTLTFTPQVAHSIEELHLYDAITHIGHRITDLNQYINKHEPWKLSQDKPEEKKQLEEVLTLACNSIRQIAFDLSPFIPESSETILKQFSKEKIESTTPYFERKK